MALQGYFPNEVVRCQPSGAVNAVGVLGRYPGIREAVC